MGDAAYQLPPILEAAVVSFAPVVAALALPGLGAVAAV